MKGLQKNQANWLVLYHVELVEKDISGKNGTPTQLKTVPGQCDVISARIKGDWEQINVSYVR